MPLLRVLFRSLYYAAFLLELFPRAAAFEFDLTESERLLRCLPIYDLLVTITRSEVKYFFRILIETDYYCASSVESSIIRVLLPLTTGSPTPFAIKALLIIIDDC